MQVRIISAPVIRVKTSKAEAVVEGFWIHEKLFPAEGKVLVYFSKENDIRPIDIGTRLLVKAPLQEILPCGNPGAFEYKRYAAFKNIHYTLFLKNDSWRLLYSDSGFSLMRSINRVRSHINRVFEKYAGPDKKIIAVAQALVIGYKDDLDKEILADYGNTGVIHIIAISGLHLALIYALLEWIWKILTIHRRKILSGSLSILFLWLFSLLTGGSASVLRSAVMFTFVIVGKWVGRPGSVYNSLAASAFFLLCYDPFLLWDAGFHLSHLAVLGLVMLHRPLYELIDIESKWPDKIWEMTSVTLAAQIFTLPLCLFLFHRFPNYFLLSNMIVIPLSTVILFVGLLLILLSPFDALCSGIGWGMKYLIALMNGIVKIIGDWPGAVSENINIHFFEMLLLFLMVVFICFWLQKLGNVFFLAALCSGFIFMVLHVGIRFSFLKQKRLIVYNIPGHTTIDVISGKQYSFIADSGIIASPLVEDSLLKRSRQVQGLFYQERRYHMDSLSLLKIGKKTIGFVLKRRNARWTFAEHPDYLLISGGGRGSLDALVPSGFKGLIIFDSSCPLWKIDRWSAECDSLHLRYHSVSKLGAFILDYQ